MPYSIYKIVNTKTNKAYIGQTCRTVEERFKNHCYSVNKAQTYLHKSMAVHGIENFEVFTLVEDISCVELADFLEKHYIALLQTKSPNGYNLTPGGQGASEAHRKNNSNCKKGKNNPMYGKTGELHPNFGKKASKETREKQRLAKLGKEGNRKGKKCSPETIALIKAKRKLQDEKSGVPSPGTDMTKYNWVNKDGRTEYCTRFELRQKYPELAVNNLSQVVRGTKKSHKGWKLL